jgi:hypothetical protein
VRQFVLRDNELVRFASTDHKVTFAAASDLASNGTLKEAVPQPFDYDLFKVRKRLSHLTTRRAWIQRS